MSKEMKMADVWGFGNVPQDYTKFNGYKHDNGDWNNACYGLLFLTEEAAESQAYALRVHDRLVDEVTSLREALEIICSRLNEDGVNTDNIGADLLRGQKLLNELGDGDEKQ